MSPGWCALLLKSGNENPFVTSFNLPPCGSYLTIARLRGFQLHNQMVGASRSFEAARSIPLLFLIVIAMFVNPVRAVAESKAPFLGYVKYVRYRSSYQVNADGTDVETCEW